MRFLRTIPALIAAIGLPALAQGAPKQLSLQEAIATALQNNLQVQIARTSQEQGAYGVMGSLGAYDWRLSSSFGLSKNITDQRVREGNDNTLGHVLTTSNGNTVGRNLTVGLDKSFEWGGSFNASYAPNYSNTSTSLLIQPLETQAQAISRASNTAYPYSGGLSVSYTQSLLKNFGRDVAGADLIISRKNAEIADFTFQGKLIDVVSTIESQYWDVINAERTLTNKQKSLELAQKQLRENKIRVEVGNMAPIEITSAEAAVALREQEIIQAVAQLANAKDTLTRSLYPDQERPSDLKLIDEPTLSRMKLSEEDAQKMALDRRVELKIAQTNLSIANTQIRVAEQNRLPQLDVKVGMTADANAQRVLNDINKDLAKRSNPGYSLGLTFAMPIQNRAAEATLATRRAVRRSSELGLKDQQLAITLEVRTALRSVEAAEQGVKAAEKSRIFKERDFDAEQKKFENGMSTNFVVLSKQNELDSARANELQAQIAYAKSVTAFERAIGNLLEARKLAVK